MTAGQAELLRQALPDFEKYASLPFLVYITDAETGTFLKYNNSAADFFLLKRGQENNITVVTFYRNPLDRNYIMNILKEALISEYNVENNPENWLSNGHLELKIQSKNKSLRFFAKPYANSNGNLLGALALAFPIPEIERFNKLEDTMPIGIFETGVGGRLIYSNKRFEEMLGTYDGEALHYAKDFFDSEADYEEILKVLQTKELYESGPVVLRKTNGNRMLANLSALAQYTPKHHKLLKVRGIVRDLTLYEIMNKAPIGIYFVTEINGVDVIAKANEEFARIHEFKDNKDCIGYDIKNFFTSEQLFEDFLEKLNIASNNGEMLKNYEMETITQKGNRRLLRANVINYKSNRHPDRILGRIGIVLDITNDVNKHLSDWKKDYAGFLHSYANMLISMRDTLNSVISAHGTDIIVNRRVDMKAANFMMTASITRIQKEWPRLLAELTRYSSFSPKKIENWLHELNRKEDAGFKEKANWVRQTLWFIRSDLNTQLKDHKYHKEAIKPFQQDIADALRYARLISLGLIVDDIPDILADIDNFKAILMEDSNNPLEKTEVNIVGIVNNSIKSLVEFAQSRNAIIKKHYDEKIFFSIIGNNRALESAIYNILHNAIKYSRTDVEFGKLTVDVFVTKSQHTIEITVINLGVPIRKKEIENRLIFKFGTRGADSMLDGRKGSGIGLWHANTIIEEHGGYIHIQSSPGKYDHEEDYRKWFKTTVKIAFPIIES